MPTNSPELFSSAAGVGSGLRVEASTIQPKLFGTGSGTLAKLTAVSFNTSTKRWGVWDASSILNDTFTLRGFVWVDTITLHATNDVIGNIMLAGKVHYADLPADLGDPGAPTAAQVNTALRNAQTFGLIVEGIPSGV